MDPVLGFTRDEIIEKVLDTAGRTGDPTLTTRLETDINLYQLGYWKEMDWKWGRFNGLADNVSFPLVQNQGEYVLNTATIGYEVRLSNVDRFFINAKPNARVLTKVPLRDIRAINPSTDDTGTPTFYAESDKNKIVVYPIPDSQADGVDVYIDGRRMPTPLTLGTDYPDIPIESQETFIQYIIYKVYIREEDPRSEQALGFYKDLRAQDERFDIMETESNLKMKWPEQEFAPYAYNRDFREVMWESVD